MNRKEGIIVGSLLITTFFASTFAAPVAQNMFITNDPLNIRVIDDAPSVHVGSLDVEVLANMFNGVPVSGNFPTWNLTAAFSFSPHPDFIQTARVLITIDWNRNSNGHDDDRFSVRLNDGPHTLLAPLRTQTTQVGSLPPNDLIVGSNVLNLGIVAANPAVTTDFLIYQVRLTVEYTFIA